MQAFKRNYLQHALAVSSWMRAHDAVGGLDPLNHVMEITCAGKTVRFFPQFTANSDQGMCFINQLNPGTNGFVGWYPYLPKGWPIAQNKLLFKEFAKRTGLRTPAWTLQPQEAKGPVLIKRAVSSLGAGQRGPFMASSAPSTDLSSALAQNEYCEQFITGQLLKAWYWCEELAVVEVVNMPSVLGDGEKTVRQLIQLQTGAMESNCSTPLLQIQDIGLDETPRTGRRVIVDYQYMASSNPALHADYNCRERIRGTPFETQLQEAGRLSWAEVPLEARSPGAAISLDGVVDLQGRVWFLEANCNPLLHPAFYTNMLDALFLEPKPESQQ